MRTWLRTATNKLLAPLGIRAVSTRWGPRGPWDALRRVRACGIQPTQVVDVGASDGVWTRGCLEIFPQARYLLIDPMPANRRALERLAAEHPSIRFWSGAAGATEGTLEIHCHGDQSSFLASDSFPADRSERVEVRPLDSFLGTDLLNPPDFIKADVQGYELEVLAGATECLRTVQILLLEVSFRRIYQNLPLAHEVIARVGETGLRIYDICTYASRPSDGELVQADILFARDGSPVFADESWS